MPSIFHTDTPCPECGTDMVQLRQPSNVYGCPNCGIVWVLKDGELTPALEADRKWWEEKKFLFDNWQEF